MICKADDFDKFRPEDENENETNKESYDPNVEGREENAYPDDFFDEPEPEYTREQIEEARKHVRMWYIVFPWYAEYSKTKPPVDLFIARLYCHIPGVDESWDTAIGGATVDLIGNMVKRRFLDQEVMTYLPLEGKLLEHVKETITAAFEKAVSMLFSEDISRAFKLLGMEISSLKDFDEDMYNDLVSKMTIFNTEKS